MSQYTLTAKLIADEKGLIKGFGKAQEALAKMQSKTASFSSGLKNIGKDISRVGDNLTRRITTPAVAAATALTGITLVKGFNRLTGIDTAQAKLKGLGHNAENVEIIMQSALDSVRGTAYGLDEAATTAANAVAAGIKPGKELTRYLTLTGDAAAIAGSSMGEMGSIINKVQTAQKAYTGELNQLADRGIPIFEWLGEQAGVSAEKVREMASEGKISSEMFLKAIEDNIGGAAKIMGEESFTAGIANIGAAIGRVGAQFLDAGGKGGGFFSTIKQWIPTTIEFIDGLADKSAELGVRFGESINNFIGFIADLKARFDGLSPSMQTLITRGAAIGAAIIVGIGPALKIVGGLTSAIGGLISGFSFLISPVGLVVVAIGALIAAGVLLYKNWEAIKERAKGVFSNFAPVFETMKEAFHNLVSSVQPIWESLKNLWQSLVPLLQKVGSIVGGILAVQFGVVTSVISGVVSAIGPVINAFINLVDFVVNVVNTIVALFTGDFAEAWGYWQDAVQSSVDFFMNLFNGVVNYVTTFVSTIINFFQGLYMTLVGNSIIPDMVNAIVDWFGNMIDMAMKIIKPIISFFGTVVAGIQSVVRPIINFFVNTFVNIYNTAVTNFNRVKSFIGTIIRAVSGIVGGLVSSVATVFNRIYSTASNIMNRVKNVFTTVFGAIRGAWSGLTGMVSNIFSGISNSVQQVVGQVKGFVNIVIRSINSAVGLINKIPGVNISPIPQLQRGTDNWMGGFAYMNEGGRGELVHLPDGTQVIPHDVSMRYAREAGKSSSASQTYFEERTSNVNLSRIESLLEGIYKKDPSLYVDGERLVDATYDQYDRKGANVTNLTGRWGR